MAPFKKMTPSLKIVKLGGSLLDFPNLTLNFHHWLTQETAGRHIVIVGGGQMVEEIRQRQVALSWSDEDCHERALMTMRDNSQIAAKRLDLPWTDDQASLHRWINDQAIPLKPKEKGTIPSKVATLIFDSSAMASVDLSLPKCWDLTSDSLAAWFAHRIGARELILLKSRGAPKGWRPLSQGFEDWVDPLFPKFALGLKVTSVNLRAPRENL
ncbi:MAG: hypothetical protein VX520_10700 [Planctomycetota bacterium]|nr:hypothetical protein [Planctomycetota bacterium]